MGKRIDLTGQRFGQLVVVSFDRTDKNNAALWVCRCDCGNTKTIVSNSLRRNLTTSCGCYGIKMLISHRRTTHGLSGAIGSKERRLFNIWTGIRKRCFNPKTACYNRYGGRGITLCKEWKDDYKLFYDWSMKNGYTETLSIDRIDSNGNYEPENCQWISKSENSRKKTTTFLFTIDGIEKSTTEWALYLNKDIHSILKYYKLNGYDKTVEYLTILANNKSKNES